MDHTPSITIPVPAPAPSLEVLSASIEDPIALVYVKDAGDRYLRVNRRFSECLGIPSERLLGRRDDELAPGESIDGPRVADGTAVSDAATCVEYQVDAFGQRPALAVLRFALLDEQGDRIGTCGVAAPQRQLAAAHAVGARLLALAGLADGAADGADDAWDTTSRDRAADNQGTADSRRLAETPSDDDGHGERRMDSAPLAASPAAVVPDDAMRLADAQRELVSLRAENARITAELAEARAQLAALRSTPAVAPAPVVPAAAPVAAAAAPVAAAAAPTPAAASAPAAPIAPVRDPRPITGSAGRSRWTAAFARA